MELLFLGYRLKQLPSPRDESAWPGVVEICSMSDCIRKPPPGAVHAWNGFNAGTCYNTPEYAKATIQHLSDAAHEVFAYALLPRLFADGNPVAVNTIELLGEHGAGLPSRPPTGL